jgi:hypothetical protein
MVIVLPVLFPLPLIVALGRPAGALPMPQSRRGGDGRSGGDIC